MAARTSTTTTIATTATSYISPEDTGAGDFVDEAVEEAGGGEDVAEVEGVGDGEPTRGEDWTSKE